VNVTLVNQTQSAAEPAKIAPARKSLAEELPWLPLTLTIEIPVPEFTVEDMLNLRTGSIVKTLYDSTSDVPMQVNGKLIAWAKFEVNGDRLASRITELA
jgi:flagellar motor switch protein FliM